ncbi:MAG: 4Fe-4S binding protein [Deltaproteobacteria bacterium]|nr:4Fe-4S binding protein [Deltaproteobacteria bacterium]
MGEKRFLSGNEAVARGAWEAGVRLATSYPGSPTAQLLESLARYPELHAEWSTNEKVALEVGIGASLAGARVLVAMKHVGVNIASDPLLTFSYTRVNGGFVLAVGDDPGMHSSQNEQDSRCWGPFGFLPILEPGDPQQAFEMTKAAFALSEEVETPVLLRLFDKTAHMAGAVGTGERVAPDVKGFRPDPNDSFMTPPYSIGRRRKLEDRMERLRALAEASPFNEVLPGRGEIGLVASGYVALYAREVAAELPLFRLGTVFPLPLERLRSFAREHRTVVVVEELLPFIEKELLAAGIRNVVGKALFPSYGEITPESLHAGLVAVGADLLPLPGAAPIVEAVPRSPLLCAGCPHRPVLRVLKDLKVSCHGDIGCYLMGAYEPLSVFPTSISMGASLGVSVGMEKIQGGPDGQSPHKPNVSVMGDSTFVHSALPSLANATYNGHPVKLVVLDNRATSMTGGQENPSTGKDIRSRQHRRFDFAGFARLVGIDEVHEVDQFRVKELKVLLKEHLEAPGRSAVIVAQRPCALKYKTKQPPFFVDPDVCIACRTCLTVACPPISMQPYAHKPEGTLNSFIDANQCVGCSVCAQFCPVGAIQRTEPGKEPEAPRPVGFEREG